MTDAATDATLAYYAAHWDDQVKRYESARVAELHALLKSGFGSGSRLLELGCGSGRDAAFMLANGFDVTASDAVPEMIEAAALCHPELRERLCRIRLPGDLTPSLGPYDGIYVVAALMHLSRPDIRETFFRLSRIVIPEGRLFFSVPLRRNDVQADEVDAKGRRFTAMTRSDWFDSCRRAGFDIIESTVSDDGLGRDTFAWLNCLAENNYMPR